MTQEGKEWLARGFRGRWRENRSRNQRNAKEVKKFQRETFPAGDLKLQFKFNRYQHDFQCSLKAI